MLKQPKLLTDLPPGMADALLRNDLATFTRATFGVTNPGAELIWAPYLDLICSRLQAVADGHIRRLIITVPPRHLKSICASVALPAFFLGQNPSAEVMCVSYNQKLSKKFGEDTKAVMTSPFYTGAFDTRLASGRQAMSKMMTTARGARLATSMLGMATGVGADLLIFDDPQNASGILSDKVRGDTNELFRSTFMSRANNPAKSRTIIVMQRLHEDDFVGFVTSLGLEWTVLNLPAIAEEDEAIPFTTFMGPHTFRRTKGEPLHPVRLPLPELAEIREQMGEAIWDTQYMQRPAPAGGAVVNTAWLKRYDPADLPDTFGQVIQSWDVASKIGDNKDYSVCTTWGVKDKHIYLLDVFRKRLIYPDLKKAVIRLAALHNPTTIVIEDASSGTPLIQDLTKDGVQHIRAFKPVGDKRTRMEGETGRMEAGFVHVPNEAHWLEEFLHELAMFPNGKHDDQVDSVSQALKCIDPVRVTSWGLLDLYRQQDEERHAAGEGYHPIPVTYAPGSMEYAAEQAALAAAKLAA